MSVAHLDRLMGCSDCMLLVTGPLCWNFQWIRVTKCSSAYPVTAVWRRKLYQTAGHLRCVRFSPLAQLDIPNYPHIVILQCELSALCRNHETFSAKTESSPNVIHQYSAENETCQNSSNRCFSRRNQNRTSVGLYSKCLVALHHFLTSGSISACMWLLYWWDSKGDGLVLSSFGASFVTSSMNDSLDTIQ